MRSAAARLVPHDTDATVAEPLGALATPFPPAGASPAGDLQRRVAAAALNGFFKAPAPSRWADRRRIVAMVAIATGCWAAVFAAVAALAG